MNTMLCNSYDTALPVIKMIDLAETGVAAASLEGLTITIASRAYTLGKTSSVSSATVFGNTPIEYAASLAYAINGDYDTCNVRHKIIYDNLGCSAHARGSKVFLVGRIEAADFTVVVAGSLLTVNTITT